MKLNAPRVKNRAGLQGRFVRESDYQAAMELATMVNRLLLGQATTHQVTVALDKLKQGQVTNYPSVIAIRQARIAARAAAHV